MKLIVRKASVRWSGGVKGGTRTLTTQTSVLKRARFSMGFPLQNDSHANPAELIAAAHADSFSLALLRELGKAALKAGEIITTATATLENGAAGWTIINIHLNVLARLLKVSQRKFIDATVRANTNCMVSRLLRASISVNAKLEK